jgi:DNA helicase HerA-like ATPase
MTAERDMRLQPAASGAVGQVAAISGAGAVIVLDPRLFSGSPESGRADGRVAQIGTILRIDVGDGAVYATVRGVTAKGSGQYLRHEAEVDFLGQGRMDAAGRLLFSRGVYSFPVPGQTVILADDTDFDAIFSPRERAHIKVGRVYPAHRVTATVLTDPLLSRHFAIMGSTGTGKSCTVSLLLHRLVERLPNAHVLVLDPHDEYGGAFADQAVRFNTGNLKLPYWLMNLEEHVELFIGHRTAEREVEVDILKRCLLAARKEGANRSRAERVTVDTPIPYRISDLLGLIDADMGRLDKPEKLLPFLRLKTKIEELKNDPRYAFMFSGLMVNDSLQDIIARLLRFPVAKKPVSIIDLSGVPADIVDVVVSVLCRLVFDFSVWSRREAAQPLLLVCEEAHRYIPAEPRFGQDAARKALERIAKEGRKYGVSLGIVSQRPADLAASVLSQCGTIFAMRMNNDRDQAFVEKVMPEGSGGFLAALPSLQNREAIVVGEGVAAPLRILLDPLQAHQMPAGDDPCFEDAWKVDLHDAQFVARVIERWRSDMR